MAKEEKVELLVVASKVKKYIKEEHGLNTSANALAMLTERVKEACDTAADVAQAAGRKTVMDKDV